MELIGPDIVTEHEQEVASMLIANPCIAREITYLLNAYRSTLENCMEQMREAHIDVADTQKKRTKIDNRLRRLGIPVLETAGDWEDLHEQYRKQN